MSWVHLSGITKNKQYICPLKSCNLVKSSIFPLWARKGGMQTRCALFHASSRRIGSRNDRASSGYPFERESKGGKSSTAPRNLPEEGVSGRPYTATPEFTIYSAWSVGGSAFECPDWAILRRLGPTLGFRSYFSALWLKRSRALYAISRLIQEAFATVTANSISNSEGLPRLSTHLRRGARRYLYVFL